jgi:hypothetical protein
MDDSRDRWRPFSDPKKSPSLSDLVKETEILVSEALGNFVGKPNTPIVREQFFVSVMHALRELAQDNESEIKFEVVSSGDDTRLVVIPLNGFTAMLLARLNKGDSHE